VVILLLLLLLYTRSAGYDNTVLHARILLFILYPVRIVDYDDVNPRAVTVIVKIIIMGHRRKHSSIKSAPKSTVVILDTVFIPKRINAVLMTFFLEHFRPHQTPAVKLWPRLYNMQVVIAFARVPGDVWRHSGV